MTRILILQFGHLPQVNGGASAAEKVDFAYKHFEQPIPVDAVLNKDEMIDTIAITRGRGTEGVITRWGVTRLPRKTHRGLRKVPCWSCACAYVASTGFGFPGLVCCAPSAFKPWSAWHLGHSDVTDWTHQGHLPPRTMDPFHGHLRSKDLDLILSTSKSTTHSKTIEIVSTGSSNVHLDLTLAWSSKLSCASDWKDQRLLSKCWPDLVTLVQVCSKA